MNNAVSRTGQLLAIAAIPPLVGLTGDAFADPERLGAGFDRAMLIAAALVAAGALGVRHADEAICLDKEDCPWESADVLDVAVIDDPAAAEVSLDPIRSRLLSELVEPSSASMLAARIGLARQKVNYHLRALERHGLIELVEERRKGNCTERVLRASAASYVISPSALAAVQPDPARSPDQVSAQWLLAVAARLVRDVGSLVVGSRKANKRVATFAIDGEVRFGSAAERAAFAEELSAAVTSLVRKYHTDGGRSHRMVIAVHPTVTATAVEPQQTTDV